MVDRADVPPSEPARASILTESGRGDNARQLTTLWELARSAAEPHTVDEACRDAALALAANPVDVPFAVLYMVDADGRTARRLAQTGLPDDHPAAPAVIAIPPSNPAGTAPGTTNGATPGTTNGATGASPAPWPVSEAIATGQPVVVPDLPARFGPLPGGRLPDGEVAEPCHTAVVLPLTRPDLAPCGVLVAGTSTRRALDGVYTTFLELAAAHIAAAIRNARAHEAQRQLAASAITAQQESLALHEKFTAMLGHDLRNPLNAITTAAQLLQRRATTPEIARPSARIVLSAERMARMIAQLLDLARVRVDGGLSLQPRPLDLSELCQLVLDELRQNHPGPQLELTATGSLHGRWDGDRLAQVIGNLAGNALEHGDIRAPVRVELDGREPGRVSVRVENRGAIPPDVLPVLFEPFRGLHQRSEHTRGLGLGLYISKAIVTAHGGTIDVRSNREDGTCFEIALPKDAENAS